MWVAKFHTHTNKQAKLIKFVYILIHSYLVKDS